MIPRTCARVLALAGLLTLAACGGGGGGSTAVTPAPVPTPTPIQTAVTFTNVSVHDPAVIKVDSTWYVFRSHLAAAEPTDLMNWTKVADRVNAANSARSGAASSK